MSCPHNHLRFSDGHFVVQCIDCDQKWNAVDDDFGSPAYELKSIMPQPFRDTRHDRFVLSRTEKVPAAQTKPPVK